MTTIADCIHLMEEWFKKPLSGGQFEMFVDRIRFIPPKAMLDIVNKYMDDNAPMPGRFPTPAKIREGWNLWKMENPTKVKSVTRTDCPDCDGTGFLWFKQYREETKGTYEVVARCAACENWLADCNHGSPIPLMFKNQIDEL